MTSPGRRLVRRRLSSDCLRAFPGDFSAQPFACRISSGAGVFLMIDGFGAAAKASP